MVLIDPLVVLGYFQTKTRVEGIQYSFFTLRGEAHNPLKKPPFIDQHMIDKINTNIKHQWTTTSRSSKTKQDKHKYKTWTTTSRSSKTKLILG